MKTIILDDEAQSHQMLGGLLINNHPEVQVVASGYTVNDGLQLVKEHQPELVFLDIELPDGLGFDLLEQLEQIDFNVIFITAYGHYARTAIRFGALDFLLKPISKEDLALALRKAKENKKRKITEDQLQIMWETLQRLQEKKLPTRLGISTSDGIHYKPVRDIVRLEAQQNYTEFIFAERQKKILASVNLGEYEEQFSPYQEFMRVHRSHIVNLHFVDTYVKSDGGYLVLRDGSSVSVSRLYREELVERLALI